MAVSKRQGEFSPLMHPQPTGLSRAQALTMCQAPQRIGAHAEREARGLDTASSWEQSPSVLTTAPDQLASPLASGRGCPASETCESSPVSAELQAGHRAGLHAGPACGQRPRSTIALRPGQSPGKSTLT